MNLKLFLNKHNFSIIESIYISKYIKINFISRV